LHGHHIVAVCHVVGVICHHVIVAGCLHIVVAGCHHVIVSGCRQVIFVDHVVAVGWYVIVGMVGHRVVVAGYKWLPKSLVAATKEEDYNDAPANKQVSGSLSHGLCYCYSSPFLKDPFASLRLSCSSSVSIKRGISGQIIRDAITFLLSANKRMIINNRHTIFAIPFYVLTTILYHTLYVCFRKLFSRSSINQTR